MTIDGVNIWTWKLKLSDVDGLLNQPARKKTLDEDGTEAKDIKHVNNKILVTLVGEYESVADLRTYTSGFKAAVQPGEKTFAFLNYSTSLTGIVVNGAAIDTSYDSLTVKVTFEITVTG